MAEEGHITRMVDALAEARRLLRSRDRAALATSMAGWPYASLVLTACAPDGAPLLLLSRLAQHTQNLLAERRVSLLYDDTAGLDDPLTGPRVTVTGEIAAVAEPALMARYVARHPAAQAYAGFGDFALYRVEPARAHLVAGFGRIHWVEGLLTPRQPALEAAEPDIVEHMNADHREALDLYAARLAGRVGEGWTMTGIDPEGIDLRRAGEVARVPFDRLVCSAAEARAELVRMVKQAREAG